MKVLLSMFVVLALASPASAEVDLATAALHACNRPAIADAKIAALQRAIDEAKTVGVQATASALAAKLPKATATRSGMCTPALASLAGHAYPQTYIAKVIRFDVCDLLSTAGELDDSEQVQAAAVCTHSVERSSYNPAGVAIDLVQGLGDLLEVEAKQEISEYLIEQIGLKFCAYRFTLPKIKFTIKFDTWFNASCALIKKDEPDTFTYGDLKKAFLADLQALPAQLTALANATFVVLSPGQQTWVEILAVLAEVVFDAANHKTALETLQDLGDKSDAATKDVKCDFSALTAANEKECVALLLFQLARTAGAEYQQSRPPLTQILTDTMNAFCAVHGPASSVPLPAGTPPNGDCVMSSAAYKDWHQRLLDFYRAVELLLQLQQDSDRLSLTATSSEIAARSSVDLAKALKALLAAFVGIVENLPELKDDTKLADELALLDNGLDIYAAIVASDPVALRQAVIVLLKAPALGAALSSDDVHIITVIVSLATAKDRGEVKGILSDVADPVGTWKVKYGAQHVIIALNGYVGFMLGAELRFAKHDADGTSTGYGRHRAPFRIGAPVGLDFTLASWTKLHLGVTLTAIDPLALVVGDTPSVSADWKTLADFGAYFRVGALKSPFTLMLGAHYQPWNRSDEMCGMSRCFDGTLTFGALLSADVPLHVFR